ncbi:hypothetical protein CRM22_002947 [Opisthorchis felineus]|uniref:2-phosphoxylose phosphatase 1 n=1 Tax=Opisthorchis felineus TaxID=147828 RepID=A0A4S2M3I6_OPIFE|nr:hypothetical protein CRM22_002947 [Opisthorchis felineus]
MVEHPLQLVQVQIFFRHGARTPLHHVRSPNVDDAFWTPELIDDLPHTCYPFKIMDICSEKVVDLSQVSSLPIPFRLPGGLYTGELIKRGQEEAFALGRRFKSSYIDKISFISSSINQEEVYCRSTMIRRTIKSLRCVLAGMFGENLRGNPKVEPAVINVESLDREYLFPNPVICKSVDRFAKDGMSECLNSEGHRRLKQKLKSVLGVKKLYDDFRPTPWDCPVYFVRDDYTSRKSANFPLPPGMDELFPTMHQLATEELYWEYLGMKQHWDVNLHVVMSGVFKMILCSMRHFTRVPKFQLYSCHDSTLMLLLYALECFDGYWPPFAADLILELYLDADVVKILTEGDSSPQADDNIRRLSNLQYTPLDALWIRVSYLGQVVPLGCLWKTPYKDAGRYNKGYVPLRFLLERWSSSAPSFETLALK